MKCSIGRVMIGVALLAIALPVISVDFKNPSVHRHAHDLVVGVLPLGPILAYRLLGAGLDLAVGRSSRQ